MKNVKLKTIMLIAATAFSYNVMAQNSKGDVPPVVNNAFSTKYSQAQLKSWKMKNDTCIATFDWNGRNYMAYYSKDGSWLSTERNVKHMSSLPIGARTYLKSSKYASWHVDRMAKVQTPSQSMYMVHIDNHSGNPNVSEDNGSASDKYLYFSNSGTLVKTN